jgi:SM-20-related protein
MPAPVAAAGVPLTLAADEVRAFGERGVLVRDRFLGDALARAVREELGAIAPRLRPAGMSRGGGHRDARERGDLIAWLDEAEGGPALAALRAGFAALGRALRHQAYLGLRSHEIQVACYPGDGACYARHRDVFRETVGPRRRVTAIVYLNPEWPETAGGALRLHLPGQPLDVTPELDRLVVFRSETEHEVLATWVPRWAVTAWFYGP